MVIKRRTDEELFQDHPNDESKNEIKQESYDDVILRRLKASLSGVPPPPILTVPQQKVEDILNILKNSSQEMISNEKTESNQIVLKNNCSFQKALNSEWPETKNCTFFDISYNLGDLSEKMVDLYEKYRERYVGCETSSFVSSYSPSKDFLNKKKDRRKMIGYSPGRRLSHLAKRRTMFSSQSLQAASKCKTSALQTKTILVEPNKDKKSKEVKRALFHTPDEIKSKADFKSSTSKLKCMQLRHSLWLRKRTPSKGTPRKTPHKQTPKKPTPKKHTPKKNCTPRKANEIAGSSGYSKNFVGKMYQTKMTENGKRVRLDVEINDNASDGYNLSRNDSNISELSETQRKKLLWAVSAALKKVGVTCSHKNFRDYGKRLYRICKEFWTNKVSNAQLKSGISERMLSIASENVKSVIEEVQRAKSENIELFNQDSSSCDVFFSKNMKSIVEAQRARSENVELFNQDSSSCDVFFSKNSNDGT
ncbi:uncharacterized protein mi isoform X2 [Planococcus citri]|uniref:uncharacterized protein mi isoform X2 n=1 Tax=Planococcus citri TaxID=170843 RepID=UPI0031F72AF8